MGPYGVPGSRDSWTRGLGTRDLGSRGLGTRDLGSWDLGTWAREPRGGLGTRALEPRGGPGTQGGPVSETTSNKLRLLDDASTMRISILQFLDDPKSKECSLDALAQ